MKFLRILTTLFFACQSISLTYQDQNKPPQFSTYTLDVKGYADNIITRDINADGLLDILIQTGKTIKVFISCKDTPFKKDPDDIINLTDDTFLWNLGRIEEGKTLSIITMTSSGIYTYRYTNGKFSKNAEELIVISNLFKGNCSQPPLFFDFLPDINGDNLSDAIIFEERKLLIFLQEKPAEFRLIQRLELESDITLSALPGPHQQTEITTSIPILAFGDVNKDKKTDIIYYKQGLLKFFYQNNEGSFSQKADFTYEFKEKKRKRKTFFDFDFPPLFKDINGDGLIDIALIFPGKGKVHTYFTNPDRKNFDIPDDVKDIGGWSASLWLKDLNGDNKLDVIIAGVEKVGVIGALKMFISKKVSLNLHIFPSLPDGTISKEPSQSLSFSVRYVLAVTREYGRLSLKFKPNFDGDFNGDGIKDLLLMNEEGNIELYYGTKEVGFEKEPSQKLNIKIPPETDEVEPFVADLNGDGISDIVLRYLNLEKSTTVIEVMLSKK
jgi:hypothetical protein